MLKPQTAKIARTRTRLDNDWALSGLDFDANCAMDGDLIVGPCDAALVVGSGERPGRSPLKPEGVRTFYPGGSTVNGDTIAHRSIEVS
jgi:hypothetical protein